MGTTGLIFNIKDGDWVSVRQAIAALSTKLGPKANPTFNSVTISNLTASRIAATDANKTLESVDLANWIAGTSNQVIVTDDSDGSITLSLPQNIHAAAIPTFGGLLANSDGVSDIGDATHRWNDIYVSGDLTDTAYAVTVFEAMTAYNHSQDNTQAHSDYLLNNANDTTSGELTAAKFHTGSLTLQSGSITDTSGSISFGDELLSAGQYSTSTATWNQDTFQSIVSGQFSFSDDHLITTGYMSANNFITAGNVGVSGDIDTLQLASNSATINGDLYITGAVGINTASVSDRYLRIEAKDSVDDTIYGIDVQMHFKPTVANKNGIALNFIAYAHTVANNIANMKGIVAAAGTLFNSGYSGTVTDAMGLQIAIKADGNVSGADPTVTNGYAIYISSASANFGGTLTNNYGLYISDQTAGADNWAIYTNAGNIRLGGDTYWEGSGTGLPFACIHGYDENDTITIAGAGIANKVQIDSFDTDTAENNMDADHTNEHIQVTKAGFYLCTVSITIESTGAGGGDEIGIGVYKNNGATLFENCHCHRQLAGGGGDVGSCSISGIIDLAANDTIEVWIWNEDSADDVIVDDISLSLVQLGGT